MFGRPAGQTREGRQISFPRGHVLLSVTALLRSDDDLVAAQHSLEYAVSTTNTAW